MQKTVIRNVTRFVSKFLLDRVQGMGEGNTAYHDVGECPLCGRVFYYRTVKGGLRVRVRGVCRSDREKLIRFYEKLNLETIYTRFFSIIRYFEPYVDKLIQGNALVVVAENEDTGEIIAVAEAIPQNGVAEGGVVVLEKYQGRGIGMLLAAALNRALYEHGIGKIVGYILPENIKAIRLVKRLGGRLVRYYESMVLVEIPIRNPDEVEKELLPRIGQ